MRKPYQLVEEPDNFVIQESEPSQLSDYSEEVFFDVKNRFRVKPMNGELPYPGTALVKYDRSSMHSSANNPIKLVRFKGTKKLFVVLTGVDSLEGMIHFIEESVRHI